VRWLLAPLYHLSKETTDFASLSDSTAL
jgi:hypothetical protein